MNDCSLVSDTVTKVGHDELFSSNKKKKACEWWSDVRTLSWCSSVQQSWVKKETSVFHITFAWNCVSDSRLVQHFSIAYRGACVQIRLRCICLRLQSSLCLCLIISDPVDLEVIASRGLLPVLMVFSPLLSKIIQGDRYSCRHLSAQGLLRTVYWLFHTLYCQEEIIYLLGLKAPPFSTYLRFFRMSRHERTPSHFYVTVFAKSTQLRTHQSPLWSEWITSRDCVYGRKLDTLPEVPSPFYIPCLVLVRCITITDSSSFGNCLPVSRRPHMTTGWSLRSLPWRYRANTSVCNVISGKHPVMYTFFMPRRL